MTTTVPLYVIQSSERDTLFVTEINDNHNIPFVHWGSRKHAQVYTSLDEVNQVIDDLSNKGLKVQRYQN